MGGQKEKNGKSTTPGGTPGFFEKIISTGGNNTSNPQDAWDRMTEEQREARVDQLWEKARRFNKKLMYQARL